MKKKISFFSLNHDHVDAFTQIRVGTYIVRFRLRKFRDDNYYTKPCVFFLHGKGKEKLI